MDKQNEAFNDALNNFNPPGHKSNKGFLLAKHMWQAAINWYKSDKKRTTKQNALYWRRVEEIAQQANVNGRKFDSFCWHIYMKQHVMQIEFEDKNGRVITKYRELPDGTTALRSTKDMSKKAFNEYIERVVAYAVTDLDVKFSADYIEQ